MKPLKYLSVFILVSCTISPNVPDEVSEIPPEEIKEEIVLTFYDAVETTDPNTEFKPIFDGQTRTKGIKTASSYITSILTDQLINPWAIDILPDNMFIVTERNGNFVIINEDGTIYNRILLNTTIEDSGQGGLLDVLVSTDFNISHILYITLAEKTSLGSLTAVAKIVLSDNLSSIDAFTIIYRAYPYFSGSNHYGSRIVFDRDGNLFVSTGDRQSLETRPNAQSLNNGHGKILHITTDGIPVESNPFIDHKDAHKEIFSIGHRNIQGLAVHPLTQELWANEMGPQGGDELNLIESGMNYGWPVISYGEEYSGTPIGEGLSSKASLEQPIYYWDPVIAPSGMIFYTSNVIPEWENNLFIGGLKSQFITRLHIDNNIVIGEERLLENENQRFRDITVGIDGALYTITDMGRLYRIGK